jgi:hypothetical protein
VVAVVRDLDHRWAQRDDGADRTNLSSILASLTVVHRLAATLAFLIRLSSFCEDQLVALLSVLQVGETLKGKLAEDGKLKVRKKEIRALVGEVADPLCSA